MKVKCMECGLVFEKCLSLQCICPACGSSSWYRLGHEEKIDKESLEKAKELIEEIDFLAKSWLEEKGYMTFRKMGVPTMMEVIMKARAKREKEEGLAMALKCLLQQMNKDYRDFIEKYSLAGLPIDPLDLSKLYQAQLERINNIKI